MTAPRGALLAGTITARERLTAHLMRLRIGDLEGFATTGVPDEWVGLVVPGQFQSRYYTVRLWDDATAEMTVDVVLHDHGLVTEWAQTDCVGDTVGISAPKGSFAPPADARWVVLAGDLTGLPAMARITESLAGRLPVASYAEVPDGPLPGYLPGDVTWLTPPAPGESRLAAVVRDLDWPEGPGYFWMAGESAQMREIRRHLRRDLGWDAAHQSVMGYWSGTRGRAGRAVDPGPIYARGKARGLSDEQIWDEYDAARSEA